MILKEIEIYKMQTNRLIFNTVFSSISNLLKYVLLINLTSIVGQEQFLGQTSVSTPFTVHFNSSSLHSTNIL